VATRKDAPLEASQVLNADGTMRREWREFLARAPFVSGELAITSATRTSISHGLQVTPGRISAFLLNKTPEYGVAANRRVVIPVFEDANDYGVQIAASNTDLSYTIGANGIRIMREDAGNEGQFATVTNGNWKLVIVADA